MRVRGSSYWRRYVSFVVLFTAAFVLPVSAADPESLAYAVKAAFLFKFGDFIEWPASAAPSSDATFNICILGNDPFHATLDQVVAGQRVGGRPVLVLRMQALPSENHCQILYVANASALSTSAVLSATHNEPVLIVTDESQRTDAEGMIHFVIRDGRVRFSIDEEMAKEHGLKISSNLLGVALIVHPRSGP